MLRVFKMGIYVMIPTALMVGLYNLLEPVQEWVVFGAIAGLAMALAYKRPSSGGPS